MLPVLAFVFASALVAAGALWLLPRRTVVDQRLSEIAGHLSDFGADRLRNQKVFDVLKRLGNPAPVSSTETSTLRKRLVSAGYRAHEALAVFFGIRIAVALAFFLVATLLFRSGLLMSLGVCAMGIWCRASCSAARP